MSRGQEQAQVFTDDKEKLLAAVRRPDEPISATELTAASRRKPALRRRLDKHLAFLHRLATFARTHEIPPSNFYPQMTPERLRENVHER